jgi:hypothetical protein
MPFLLADSFQSSLDRLNGEEQKAAKLAAFKLQINRSSWRASTWMCTFALYNGVRLA